MNVPLQPSSSEEPEQQPVVQPSEETSIQPSLTPDPHSEETLQQPASSEPPTEEALQQPALPAEEAPSQPAFSPNQLTPEAEQQPYTETELPPALSPEYPTEVIAPQSALSSDSPGEEMDASEDVTLYGDDDDDDLAAEPSLSKPARSGVFIPAGILIAIAGAIVVIALVATLLVFVNRPKDPPTDWIASYTAPATSTSPSGKILYYLHWTNKNGELNGQLQLATKASGTLQSLTAPATGLYSKDNHVIYVVVTINGQADTLTGKINDAMDTLTLNQAGVSSQGNLFVFHTGNANDYKQATNQLKPGTK